MNEKEIAKVLSLDGKVAIVTGASRPKGIGFATVKALALQGAKVVISDLGEFVQGMSDECYALGSTKLLDQAAKEICRMGGEAIGVPADMTRQEDRLRLVERTIKEFGRVDILVNNAASMFNTTVMESDEHSWEMSYRVNVEGVIELTKAVIPYMKKNGGGAVVNISSGVGVGALPGMAPYVCTKHANVALTKYFAAEYGKSGIRFNVICPGNTWTDNWDEEMAQIHKDQNREIEEILETTKKAAWLNKIGTPDEIGQAAAFLASPAASFITGATLMVDGGSCEGNLH
ncbi:MAG: SDR family oxidoreductase [Lachnospiraceae bacterium]|jgi:NAD(P)-dependent dehydrogenase (short-subunit alcohol dehydrogenase family)|nr:SDR family oxidoreductase [Lachnospiraceae bacterium]